MRRRLEEIIEEINNLDNDLINELTSNGIFQKWKNGEYPDEPAEEWEEEANNQKRDAIAFITRKYKELDNNSLATNRDYEIADFKVFEEYFNIIKDEKEKELFDRELNKKMENFFNELSKVYSEEESKTRNITFGKNGNGYTSTSINIPVRLDTSFRIFRR